MKHYITCLCLHAPYDQQARSTCCSAHTMPRQHNIAFNACVDGVNGETHRQTPISYSCMYARTSQTHIRTKYSSRCEWPFFLFSFSSLRIEWVFVAVRRCAYAVHTLYPNASIVWFSSPLFLLRYIFLFFNFSFSFLSLCVCVAGRRGEEEKESFQINFIECRNVGRRNWRHITKAERWNYSHARNTPSMAGRQWGNWPLPQMRYDENKGK